MVHARLDLLPYNRQALRLVLPAAASALVTVGGWWWVRPQTSFWAMIAVLGAAYAVFVAIAAVVGLDPDDRIIARAVWQRLRALRGGRR